MGVGTYDAILKGLIEVLVLVLAAVAFIGASRILRQALRDKTAVANLHSRQYALMQDLARDQADVIAAMISELASRPRTYETFPPDLRDRLYSAHTSAQEITRTRRGNLNDH